MNKNIFIFIVTLFCSLIVGCKKKSVVNAPDSSFVIEEYIDGEYYETSMIPYNIDVRLRALNKNDKYYWRINTFLPVGGDNKQSQLLMPKNNFYTVKDSITFSLETESGDVSSVATNKTLYINKTLSQSTYFGDFICTTEDNQTDSFIISIKVGYNDTIKIINFPKGQLLNLKNKSTAFAGGNNLVLKYINPSNGIASSAYIRNFKGVFTLIYFDTTDPNDKKIQITGRKM